MSILTNFENIQKSLPKHVKLVVVSKMQNKEDIMTVYQPGHRIFGENKAQELISKQPLMPADIEWHFIGHLQTNKVKYIAPFIAMIHSVDSLKLLKEINKEALKNNRIIDCLLEFHIAQEDSKHGMDLEEAQTILESDTIKTMKNVRICGVMGMATFTDNVKQVRLEFKSLKGIFDKLKTAYFASTPCFCEISMGMSDDYTIAIDEGSTLVRVGSAIFKK